MIASEIDDTVAESSLKPPPLTVQNEKIQHDAEHNNNDNSNGSADNESSLSEDMDSSSDDESESLELDDNLERVFETRDVLLNQLTEGIDPTSASILREAEGAVRDQMKLSAKASRDGEIPKPSKILSGGNSTGRDKKSHSTDQIRAPVGTLDVVKSMLPGFMILLLNCAAYNCCTQLASSLLVFLFHTGDTETLQFNHAMLSMIGIAVMCFTGGLADWADEGTRKRIKSTMKYRLRLGKWDALLMKWFRKHEDFATFLDVQAFFLVSPLVYAIQECVLRWAFDIRHQLFEAMPSVKQGVLTSASERIARGLAVENVQSVLGDAASCRDETCSLDDAANLLVRQDEEFLAAEVAADCYSDLVGNAPGAILVTETVLFCYYLITCVVAVVMLRRMGHRFWCDF